MRYPHAFRVGELMVTGIGRIIASCVLLSTVMADHDAWAMSVTPNNVELRDSGHASSAVLKIFNPHDYPLPVELGVRRISLNETGDPDTLPTGSDITVFPPSALIPPGATQTVNVVWSGSEPLQQSRTYFIHVNQVPVKMPANTNGIRLVTNFRVIANVAPSDAIPEISIESVDFVRADQLPTGLRRRLPPAQIVALVTVLNTGNRHASLSAGELQLRAGGWSRSFGQDELFAALGLGLVQPGKRRQFAIPVDNPPVSGTVAASYLPR